MDIQVEADGSVNSGRDALERESVKFVFAYHPNSAQ